MSAIRSLYVHWGCNLLIYFPTMVYIMSTAIYMKLQRRFLPFQLLLDVHRHTYLPKHYQEQLYMATCLMSMEECPKWWQIPPMYATINYAEYIHPFPSLLKNLLLSKDYIWITPLIESYYPFSVCTKVGQIPLSTSTTFHWIWWNILQH